MTGVITLGGGTLTAAEVVAIARGGSRAALAPEGLTRAAASHDVAKALVGKRGVYGRTTGVGANRSVQIDDVEAPDHGLNLLRSHAGGAGPLLDAPIVRAMLAVRANQLAVGGAGVQPELITALVDLVNSGRLPTVYRFGAIGTADLTALASTAMCMIGELPWRDGELAPVFHLAPSDVLAFCSSNAATIGEAALACHDLGVLLRASTVITGLSFLAVDGSTEAYAEAVQSARPYPGQLAVATRLRTLLADAGTEPATRIQDPFGFRALPQVHGPAVDAVARLAEVLGVEMNAAAENPLISSTERDAFHNGNFHTAYLAHALDGARTAVFSTAALVAARLANLVEPTYTGLRPFLAAGPSASSGVMILEYVSQSALAELRHAATPATLGNAVLSRGAEDHASFSAQAANRTTDLIGSYQTVLACELVAAVRALRLREREPRAGALRVAYEKATTALDARLADRPLDTDLANAITLLPELGDLSTN
ncbi:MAG TPA: aromatic amino acid ammonia-lyase [Pseudonocardiaceae bacterium]|jgi:histidine ammonia-lyase